jgi:hypothetical protein
MKHLYAIAISASLLTSCSKDFLKPFEDRIVGTWQITDVNRVGVGGSSSEIHFREGAFTFNEDGTLEYIDANGDVYNGSWDIRKRTIDNNIIRNLQITAVNFNSQTVLSEFYDEMNFRGTDHFVAKINTPFRTFVTHFER